MKYLGSPYECGKTNAIVSRECEAVVEEGKFVADAGNNTVVEMATGKTPYGVMGAREIKGSSVVVQGSQVWVQTADSTAPVIGKQVYVTPAGLASSSASGNTGVNAVFASVDIASDGIVTNGGTKRTNQKCVLISFIGGL